MEYWQQNQMPADGYGPPKRAEERALPRRVRGMLDEIRSHGCALLQHSLRDTLTGFERQLFTLAEKTRNPTEQQHCFDSRTILQAGRCDFEAVFNQTLQRSLRVLGAPSPCLPITDGTQRIPRELSLVDPIEQERSVILDQLAARAESRHSRVLFELGYRLAAVQASAPVKGEQIPFAPKAITRALDDAIRTLPTMRPVHGIQLLHTFESGLMAELEPLYRIANERLIAGGVLPHLRAFPQARSVPRAAAGATGIPSTANAAPPRPQVAEEVRHEVPSVHGSHVDHPRSESIVVLDELRHLLAQQRTPAAHGMISHVATADELTIALDALQKHLTDVADHATREIRSAQALREEILNQLNSQVGTGDAQWQLSSEQHDMIDLIALLFQQLSQQVPAHDRAKAVFGGLQLPMLRMAMIDNSFFSTREHPAHKLLNAVAETAQYWLQADGQTDHAVVTQLTKLVERANREPPSSGLYASLLADIEHQLGILGRKAQLAERRHIETMQGRERLDQARQRASVLMAERFMRERFAMHHPRGLVRVLLEHAWTDVLALSLLRNGEDSATFAQWLRLTDQLFGALPITDRAATQEQIEHGLQQIGMQAEEASQIALRLLSSVNHVDLAVATDALPPATDLAIRLKQRTRLGTRTDHAAPGTRPSASSEALDPPHPEPSDAPPTAAARASVADTQAGELPLTAAEQAMFRHLQRLPFGTWFSLLDKSGQRTERKLSWYSPVSGKCLLVSRRGLRADDLSMRQMARELASGRMQEMMPGRGNLLEQAWDQLTANLRRLGAGGRQSAAV